MFLKGKNYIEPEKDSNVVTAQKKTAIKNKIKALVKDDEKKLYKEIINAIEQEYLESDEHLHSDVILECVKAVDLEWHPIIEEIK